MTEDRGIPAQRAFEAVGLSYPVLAYWEDYIYVAHKQSQLCLYTRRTLADSVQFARRGKSHLLDSSGRHFLIADFAPTEVMGSWIGQVLRLLRIHFAVPVLSDGKQLPLKDFKVALAKAVWRRYRYDGDKDSGTTAIAAIRKADSYRAAMDALPKL